MNEEAARNILKDYTLTAWEHGPDQWRAVVQELPGTLSFGETKAQAEQFADAAAVNTLMKLRRLGVEVPRPGERLGKITQP